MNRPHLRWSDYDSNGDVLPDGYKRLKDGTIAEIGCTQCPYAGHIEAKECPDAYTYVSRHCNLYKHEPLKGG